VNDVNINSDAENMWVRLLYMIFFVLAFGIAEFVLYLLVVVGFVLRLFGKTENSRVRHAGRILAIYSSN
jgi:hypothetical protein